MSNKHAHNEAGGSAYAFSPAHALAQYAVTGTFHGSFYGNRQGAARSRGRAGRRGDTRARRQDRHLVPRERPDEGHAGIPRRSPRGNFVQIVRSGVTGRKSIGSAPKRALVRGSRAARPTSSSASRSVSLRPCRTSSRWFALPPWNDKGEADDVREALYGYLIGKNIDADKLPALPRAFEAWKRGKGDLPDVPFEMLTPLSPLPLSATHWKELARRVDKGVPREIVDAIKQALEYSVSNVPELGGRVVLCPDVSGSMQSPVTGHRSPAIAARRPPRGAASMSRRSSPRPSCGAIPARSSFRSRTTSCTWIARSI